MKGMQMKRWPAVRAIGDSFGLTDEEALVVPDEAETPALAVKDAADAKRDDR